MSKPRNMCDVPYTVEVYANGCEHCGARRLWTVVTPAGRVIGEACATKIQAEDKCASFNNAWQAGYVAALEAQKEQPC